MEGPIADTEGWNPRWKKFFVVLGYCLLWLQDSTSCMGAKRYQFFVGESCLLPQSTRFSLSRPCDHFFESPKFWMMKISYLKNIVDFGEMSYFFNGQRVTCCSLGVLVDVFTHKYPLYRTHIGISHVGIGVPMKF